MRTDEYGVPILKNNVDEYGVPIITSSIPSLNFTPQVESKNEEVENRFNKIKDELDKTLALKYTGNKFIEVKDAAYKQLAVLKQKALNSSFQDKEGEDALLSSFENKSKIVK